MVIVIMEGRQCTYNTYKGSTIEVLRMSSLALAVMLLPLLCFWLILRTSQVFSHFLLFFALLLTHHACFLNIWRIPPHSMPLLPPPKYCWIIILASFFFLRNAMNFVSFFKFCARRRYNIFCRLRDCLLCPSRTFSWASELAHTRSWFCLVTNKQSL